MTVKRYYLAYFVTSLSTNPNQADILQRGAWNDIIACLENATEYLKLYIKIQNISGITNPDRARNNIHQFNQW